MTRKTRPAPEPSPASGPSPGPWALATALLLLATAAAPASAVLLWKRGRTGGGDRAASSGPSTAEPASALPDGPGHVPVPEDVTSYPHELKRLRAAAARLHEATGDAERARALVAYGNVLVEMGRDTDGAAVLAEAVRLDPDLDAAWNNLGSVYRRQGQLDRAEAVFTDLIARDRRSGLAWFNLALTRELLGDLEGADQAYGEALRLEPALWLPSRNPLIVGNERANRALHAAYLERSGGRGVVLATP